MNALLEFLYELADALERHYEAQLMRYTRARSEPSSPLELTDAPAADPPF